MERAARSGPIIQIKADQLIADLLGTENETRARIRGHGADFFRSPLSRPRPAAPSGSRSRAQVLCIKKADQLIADPLGAENETRTRDPNLGKVVLYQLSYFRIF